MEKKQLLFEIALLNSIFKLAKFQSANLP